MVLCQVGTGQNGHKSEARKVKGKVILKIKIQQNSKNQHQ